ncbi:MAG: hypothetical protein IT364_16015 [Candidatus Hydrogenedentes bacterium]|nr:hypothetical protein [Candidatus Hydrogenedentota bacterium]
MPKVSIMHMREERALKTFSDAFREEHPALRFGRYHLHAHEAELVSPLGGMTVFWLYEGRGEVFLPAGYRTKEGDGSRLPAEYTPEAIDPALAETLAILRDGQDTLAEGARVPVQAILSRWHGDVFLGDFAGDLWKLEHLPAPWSGDPRVHDALERLFGLCFAAGYSRKTHASWEPIMEGDQLIVAGEERLRVRGTFACLTLDNANRHTSHVPAAMRLRFLKDTSGGCNFDFDPFRRLPLTWYMDRPGQQDDGVNFVNSHVVNIAKETSPSHFHPPHCIGEGCAQNEFYLVLDPGAYALHTHGRRPSLVTYPDLLDLSRFEEHPLEPGSFVHIPPGTGHRGLDVFVNVITIPGFRPHNEYYMDRDIADHCSNGPYNADLFGLKNYTSIREFLTPAAPR